MAHLGEKPAFRIQPMTNRSHLRYSVFHPSCTHIQISFNNVEKGTK